MPVVSCTGTIEIVPVVSCTGTIKIVPVASCTDAVNLSNDNNNIHLFLHSIVS